MIVDQLLLTEVSYNICRLSFFCYTEMTKDKDDMSPCPLNDIFIILSDKG